MSMIGTPCLAMLLVLANIALCLTADLQRRGPLKPPSAAAALAGHPLAHFERRGRPGAPTGLAAKTD